MKYKRGLIIAIDGHSSTGKSSYAKMIAKELNYIYVDTGAMYRAVTLDCMEKGLFEDTDSPEIEKVLQAIEDIEITFRKNPDTGANETYKNGRCIEKEIRTMEVSDHVSYISTIPGVRTRLVALQREIGVSGGVVMDGRDIGTVVYPGAQIKIYMTAGVEVRAERRRKELEEKGSAVDFEKVKRNIEERDRIDSGREVSPLRQAEDALLLDNSNMSFKDQMEWFFRQFGNLIFEHDKTD